MPRKKAPGSLTGSQSFRKSKSVGETVVDGVKSVTDAITQQADSIVSSAEMTPEEAQQQQAQETDARARENLKQRFNSDGSSTSTGTANVISNLGNYASSKTVQHGIAIPQFDVNSMVGSDLYSPAPGIPETSIVEATRTRQIIARQSNTLDIAVDKVALTRKAVKVATEIRHLEGDAVDYDTAGIQIATKVVKNQQADRDYQTETSRLDMKDELLKQQRIATAGTQALTPLIQEEWNLKVLAQQSKNESLKVDIEKGQADITRKQNELEVKLLEATII